MTPTLLIALLTLIAALAVVTRANAGDPRKGVVVSNTIVATWSCQDKLPAHRTHARSPWKHHSRAYWVRELNLWTLRLKRCRATLARRAYEWNWQTFPAWIITLARCESGINWYAEGSSQDGTFYSAFNISRSVYDRDAHHMGVRGWHEGPGVPSPWEQAQAAIGHVRLYGDGFTGRCHGIARSTW